MGEQVYHGAQPCSGTNLRRCQDLGDSILLILGSFILLNVGINVVTLLWKHLKNSLRILFHHFFPKDKLAAGLSSRPMYMRCITDPKNLCSRMPSRFHGPGFLLGRLSHLDSWIPDTNDENVSRCCWMPPQCGHGRAPTEDPWELWKEELMGAGEAPQATVMKTQASLFFRSEVSPQIPKICQLNTSILPPSSPQENKTKSDDSPPHTLAQTQPSERTQLRAQGLEYTSAQTPPAHAPDFTSAPIPALSGSPIPAKALPPAPTLSYPPVQAPTHSKTHTFDEAQSQSLPPITLQGPAHNPEQTSAHTSPQLPIQAPADASFQSQGHDPVQILVHTLTHPHAEGPEQTSPASAHGPSHSLLPSCAHTPGPSPTSAPAPCSLAPVPACAPDPALALSMTMKTTQASAQVPVTTSTPTLPPVPSMLTSFYPHLSTGHTVYDARRVKQNVSCKYSSQSSRCFRKDLNISRPHEVKGLVNSGTAEQAQKQHGEDSAEPPTGSILGYMELGNMEWKISDNAKDKFSQPKTFPFCSFHPCCSESQDGDSQAPVYPKFLVYTQDVTPKPCFHSPSTAQYKLPPTPSPCTLALPLVSPRTFVLPQSSLKKPPNLAQTPAFLSASKSPQAAHFSIPPQFSTISQTLVQPLNPENQNFNQDFGLQTTPTLVNDSGVPRNSSLTQDPGLQKNPSLNKDPGLQKNPSLNKDPGLQKNPKHQKNSGLASNPGIQKNPDLAPNSGLQKNPGLFPNPGIQKNPAFAQNPEHQKNPSLAPNPCLHKNSGYYKLPGCVQESYLCMNPSSSQDACLQKNLAITQDFGLRSSDAGVLRNLGFLQPYSLHRNIIFNQTSAPRTLSFMQDSVIYRNVALNQDTVINKNKGVSLVTDQKRPDPLQDSGGNNGLGNVQHPGVCRNVNLTQDTRPQKIPSHTQDPEININSGLTQESSSPKSPGLVQTSCLHKSSGLTQDSGDNKNLSLTQAPGIYRVPALNQDTGSPNSLGLINVTTAEKRSDLNQDVGIYSSEYGQDPNLQEYPAIDQDSGCQQDPALGRGSGFKTPGLTQKAGLCKDSGLIPDSGLNKKTSFAPGTDSAQVLGPFQTLKLTSSPVESLEGKVTSQKNITEQHVSCTSVPVNQSSCPSKDQMLSPDLKTFSEVPVLIELQPPSRRLDSQDWVYHTVDTAVSTCRKYRQMSVPPQFGQKSHCPGPGTRTGHVVFDARQKQLVTSREKCEALSPRRPRPEAPQNSRQPRRNGDIKM
ncbi:LOW QUALITY PROTEIN: uncharacterized protein SPEM3 [Microtus ochrogaster]|uniref:LOW QUALITY PROTEIN: uncharacterized protein SPEM3 n=1 Tax=Microtus ochrogaster TaxID=79684 RepID=A0ABM1U1K0_MICOH|nr:LOW QUALITY PROTEIN: uncharacterized protein SPEM3 [Microtus ochrogaster]